MTEIYLSTDIEADGPIPGEYSLMSFATVALNEEGEQLGSFYKKLLPLPTAKQDPKTMQFWKENPSSYREATTDQEDPQRVMPQYLYWLKDLQARTNSNLVFVAYPATYDFMFVYWYLIKFAGESPFGFQGLDMKSYASAVLRQDFKETHKSSMPKHWFPDVKHTHNALDDAIEQGLLFLNMLKENKKGLEGKVK